MSEEDEGEDTATSTSPAYEHPAVWDYVGRGRYLQTAVNKTVAKLYASKFDKVTSKSLINMAAEMGLINLVKWSRKQKCPWSDSVFLSSAIGGHVELMHWLHITKHLTIRWSTRKQVCAAAAHGGHTEALKWLRSQGFPWCKATCTTASSQGHVETLLWARFESSPPCPWKPVEVCKVAACNNHLHVLSELRVRGVLPHNDVCIDAISRGQVNILQWLLNTQYPKHGGLCTIAINYGSLDILKYLIDSQCPFSLNQIMPDTPDTPLHLSVRRGHTHIAAFLLETGGESLDVNLLNARGETALSLALANGSLPLIALLDSHGAK